MDTRHLESLLQLVQEVVIKSIRGSCISSKGQQLQIYGVLECVDNRLKVFLLGVGISFNMVGC